MDEGVIVALAESAVCVRGVAVGEDVRLAVGIFVDV